ncbi:hypothetical protein LMH87_007509 [Akanthomyces muscarius]|uniref:Uncharacterized protein n=1 Tax=Akanthomyces muscarius TaxID=2231603 RepID=A0A9W8QR04_AKAMU|nr:hypothetical protein LMH87_007509 [Akanthomyces muscarius]KAJ4165900.1 hypothetical protein LMH87_007509 [Akanthomyces muscarius]
MLRKGKRLYMFCQAGCTPKKWRRSVSRHQRWGLACKGRRSLDPSHKMSNGRICSHNYALAIGDREDPKSRFK